MLKFLRCWKELITDYNKADHPVMEALENSSKLSDSIDALERIPGFKKLTQWLTDQKDEMADEVGKKVGTGLDAAKALVAPVIIEKP